MQFLMTDTLANYFDVLTLLLPELAFLKCRIAIKNNCYYYYT